MTIIGLTGPIGHGKTTFAEALGEIEPRSRHFETSTVIMEVADAWHATLKVPGDLDSVEGWLQKLPGVLHDILAIDCIYEQIKPDLDAMQAGSIEYAKLLEHIDNLKQNFDLTRTPITADNKGAYRPILQWLGGYLVLRVDKTIWYREIIRRIQLCDPHEVVLCTVGGLRFPSDAETLREIGGIIVKLYRPDFAQKDVLDPTERERDAITVDCTVMNDGIAQELVACARQLLQDVRNDSLQTTYHAAMH